MNRQTTNDKWIGSAERCFAFTVAMSCLILLGCHERRAGNSGLPGSAVTTNTKGEPDWGKAVAIRGGDWAIVRAANVYYLIIIKSTDNKVLHYEIRESKASTPDLNSSPVIRHGIHRWWNDGVFYRANVDLPEVSLKIGLLSGEGELLTITQPSTAVIRVAKRKEPDLRNVEK